MNDFLRLDEVELWHVAGWTMLHFAWLGAVVMVAALVGRLVVLRRAPAAARYVAAVATLAVLAALPIAIAARLVATLPNDLAAVPPPIVAPAVGPTAHGSAVGSAPANGVAVDLAATSATAAVPMGDEPASAAAIPRQSRGLTGGDARASSLEAVMAAVESCVPYLPWVWLVGTPLTFALLATGLVGTKRLRGASRTLDDGPIADTCARMARVLRVRGRVAVAVCERIAAPVLLGIVRPLILLPPAALAGWSTDEVEMVLLHELAHVRRWDNLVNLVQRIVESLLFFHPAVWWASSWVRREREACCDAVVVAHTREPRAYAEMLIEMAARLSEAARGRGRGRPGSLDCTGEPGRPRPRLSTTLTSAMAAGPLRWRVRRILGLEDDPMLVSGKSLVAAAGSVVLIAALALVYLPSRGQAEESAAKTGDSTTDSTESTKGTEATPSDAKAQAAAAAKPVMEDGEKLADDRHSAKFPTLEQQKLADLVYKALHMELEPIGADDLARVEAFGYAGGLKIAMTYEVGEMMRGDILVGLGVWPTTSLEDVAKILRRSDLRELDPLKFYVVRRGNGGFGGGGAPPLDTVVTGRIHVGLASSQRASVGGGGTAEPPAEGDTQGGVERSSLRYDGKTFDQWRDEFQTELSPARRAEAVKAMAAFGANDYGGQAADAIFDVVKQYDWPRSNDGTPIAMLQGQVVLACTGSGGAEHIPATDWLPKLLDGVRSGDTRTVAFAGRVFRDLNGKQADLTPRLIELSRDDQLKDVRVSLLLGLRQVYRDNRDERIADLMVEELGSHDPSCAGVALQMLYESRNGRLRGEYRPELPALLAQPQNRWGVLSILGDLGPQAQPAVPQLLPIVLDPDDRMAQNAFDAVRKITGSTAAISEYLQQVIGDESQDAERVERAELLLKALPPAEEAGSDSHETPDQ